MSDLQQQEQNSGPLSPLARIIRFFLYQKLVVGILLAGLVLWGISVAPFDWKIDWLPRNPVPVDAIPNLGENQQIVFAEWEGRSPQDVEDQVTYPLTVSLLGLPGVQEIRSQSGFGFSMIFVIFEEDVEFYWSRARIVEKLNSLPAGALPAEVQPMLGPDATGLGQIYWYTLEGRDPDGNPVGGWDGELRGIQDWHVRYALQAAEGISEVSSIGGFVPEYHVDVNPQALRVFDVALEEVLYAVSRSNLDAGAGVTEINRVEYIIRGRGFVKTLADLEEAVVRVGKNSVPIRVRDVATVSRGPGPRRGALAVGGAEAVGGVVVVREGFNPLAAIRNVQEKMEEIRDGLPIRAVVDWERIDVDAVARFAEQAGFAAFESAELDQEAWLAWLRANPREVWPEWITTSQIEIVPFYDRSGLIQETLATLNDAIFLQILVTVIVVIIMILHLRTALIISSMLPLAVLFAFIAMKLAGVDANLVSLAGIAIAIGTIIDLGIIIVENVLKHLKEAPPEEPRIEVVFRGTREVGSAVLTAVATTVVSFLPVFTMSGAEGKMFIPLAFTKTFAIIGSVVIALIVVPAATHLLVAERIKLAQVGRLILWGIGLLAAGAVAVGAVKTSLAVVLAGLLLLGIVLYRLYGKRLSRATEKLGGLPDAVAKRLHFSGRILASAIAGGLVLWLLAVAWEPLGPERGFVRNLIFTGLLIGILTGLFLLLARVYGSVLRWCLANKALFLSIPALIVLMGSFVWLGFDRVMTFVPRAAESVGLDEEKVRLSRPWIWATRAFPGLGREFMPRLNEGSFLWMPTTMPHASIGEVLEVLKYQNMAIEGIPEIESVVGKIGRADSALDPAPVSMLETVIHYKSEYITDEAGRRINFRYDSKRNEFLRDEAGNLMPDRRGRPYRQWRDQIRTPDDIWDEIVRVAQVPGTTSAPPLQPIETRLVMLQTGMRAPMGVKVRAPDLETLNRVSLDIERFLREVPAVVPATVNADRVVGMPYLEIDIDREAIGRHGLRIEDVQDVISAALGGQVVTQTVEGRERYPVRVRYQRELRDGIEDIENVLVRGVDGAQIPLTQLADIQYVRGPQMIQSEDTFLTAYVTFGGVEGMAEVDVVEAAQAYLYAKVGAGDLVVPAGVSWRFAGNYENQLAAAATLRVVLPIALAIIFLILFFQFSSLPTTLIVFSSIAVAWSGGFIMFWFYAQPWFLDFPIFGVNMRELFQLHPINLSVAVWVGFLALFGIASDDAVVMATYLRQQTRDRLSSVEEIRARVLEGALRRIRPCLMTAATTILALLPILTSTGTGSEIMIPMALPSFGGMIFVLLSLFTTPVLYSWMEERKLRKMRTG